MRVQEGRPFHTAFRETWDIDDRFRKPWKPSPQNPFIFKDCTIIDPVTCSTRKGKNVIIADGKIQAVEAASANRPSYPGATIIDMKGKYLCPGLIDMHVHITAIPSASDSAKMFQDANGPVSLLRQPYICKAMLDRGFTTVRDCGGATLALKEAIEDGVFPGPRLYIACQGLSQSGGHADMRGRHDRSEAPSCCAGASASIGRICDGVPECIKGAREQLRTGADFIKIMAGGGVASPTDRLENVQFTPEEIRAIVNCAENNDTYVTAHAYTPKAIRTALENGVKGIEHGNFLDKATAELMVEKGAVLTPTLIAYQAIQDPRFRDFIPPESLEKNKAVLKAGQESLRIAANAGVKMCYGSDLIGPLSALQSEEFYQRSGQLPNGQILQAATINPAELLGQIEKLGQVKAGFSADLLVLNENPLEDITILARPEKSVLAVVKDGRVYKSRWSKLTEDYLPRHELIE